MSLSLHKRYEIIFLAKNQYGPQFGASKIAKIVKCNRKTVNHWLNRWNETKDLFDRPRSGAPRKTTVEQDQMMVDAALDEMSATSKTIHDELADDEVTVSQTTIQRRLKDAGLKYSKPLSKPLLSEWHRQQRLAWAKSMKNYDWSKVMASDETQISLHATHKFTWQRPGERKVVRTVKYPLKVNVWGCLSEKGFGRVFCFKENLNSEFLCHNVYRKALLPSARQNFGQSQWFLLEDNDPKHRSNYSRTWKSDHEIVTLSWPSLSPDMNPTENVWSLLKVKVTQRRPRTLEDLVAAIQNEWNELPRELAYNLMNSMERRVQSLIDSSGDYTLY